MRPPIRYKEDGTFQDADGVVLTPQYITSRLDLFDDVARCLESLDRFCPKPSLPDVIKKDVAGTLHVMNLLQKN